MSDRNIVPLKVNLPVAVFARVDALSQHSGQDRNTVVVELISVALAALDKELNQDDRDAIELLQREMAQAIASTA